MMSDNWSWYVIALVILNIIAMVWLLVGSSKNDTGSDKETTGHEWDGIRELNNPLPRWWFGLFILTIVYSLAYLYVYPGLGNYAGSFGWTQQSQFEDALAENRARQDAFFAEFADLDIPALATNERAMETAGRLFLNNCSTCHGSGGQGAKGFPNLTDGDWLYGGSPQMIQASLVNGRAGVMPALGLPEASVSLLAQYVQHLAGMDTDESVVERGQQLFAVCGACHGADGKGNQALGAPNLTDDIWLHGSTINEIESIIANGKQNNMPSFSRLLSANEIKLLSPYVLSIAEDQQ